jgi:hypothetical protein
VEVEVEVEAGMGVEVEVEAGAVVGGGRWAAMRVRMGSPW